MLPGVVVEADTIGVVKGPLDKHMNMQGLEEYGPRAVPESFGSQCLSQSI